MSQATRVWIALMIVYIVWGSTYLGIRVAVEHLPPALFAGMRFLIAGALMLVYAWATGSSLPRDPRDWTTLIITSLLMLGGGNGLVTWSEQWIESNQAALIVATSALWMAGFGTLGAQGERLTPLTLAGLLLGFGGVAVLVGDGLGHRLAPPLAYAALLLAPVCWAAGSVYARRRPARCTPIMSAALQMLIIGVVMSVLGLGLGEASRWTWHPLALAALAYLVIFGSCIAYGAYIWLVHQVTPAILSTYAYVNPAIAVLLGWLLLNEHLGPMQLVGTGIILAGVVLVTWAARRAAH